MSRHDTHNSHILQEHIRRQFGSTSTTRFVRSLPAFSVEGNLPDRLSDLLTKLEQAEDDRHHADRRPLNRRDRDS